MITPTYDRVVVKRFSPTSHYNNGLIIPDTQQFPSLYAEVIAVGPGKYTEEFGWRPIGVSIGDKVLVAPKAGTHVEINGEDYVVLIEDQIEAVVTDD